MEEEAAVTRNRSLPSGWYPRTCEDVLADVHRWRGANDARFTSVVVPHAGWSYSGALACRTIGRLLPAATVVICGGHLHADDPVVVMAEDGFETPCGTLVTDDSLRGRLVERLRAELGSGPDNTVEVQLPFVSALFPDSRVVCLRCPPSRLAVQTGTVLAQIRAELDRSGPVEPIVCIGSTDLTHYGPAYGFAPHGGGSGAVEWVRTENDGAIVAAMRALDADRTIMLANRTKAACSAGAAAAAIAFALGCGVRESELVGYHTSHDVSPSESFVGYAGVGFAPVPGERFSIGRRPG